MDHNITDFRIDSVQTSRFNAIKKCRDTLLLMTNVQTTDQQNYAQFSTCFKNLYGLYDVRITQQK